MLTSLFRQKCFWWRKLEHLVKHLDLAALVITVCWGKWDVSLHAGIFHMTCKVVCYEITLEKFIFLETKINDFLLAWMFGRCYGGNWPFFSRMHSVWWLQCLSFSFKNFQLCINWNFLPYLFLFTLSPKKVETGESITWLPLFRIVWSYNFAV